MVFSSPIFLFLFLPVLLAGYAAMPRAGRNGLLLAASIGFYAWGEVFFVFVMIASIAINYVFGLWVARARERGRGRGVVALAIALNLALLIAYKYANFLADNINVLLELFAAPPIKLDPVHLPIGISFFTFQAISYVIDVYRCEADPQDNPRDVALYIAMFPQLIAGPIVRYRDVAAQLLERTVGWDDFAYGVRRFCIGLGKKILIANVLAAPADHIFGLPPESVHTSVAWLAALCYTGQIYFDFSGYSDMAIGLGRMFGFRFLENFAHPYASTSITDFWRRWHISLSSWFRDYLYIPLGGNRRGTLRTYLNLVTVFLLCGLWHGASWNFVIWGLIHGGFLVAERLVPVRTQSALARPVRHVYVMLVAILGWVFFRAETLPEAISMLTTMCGLGTTSIEAEPLARFVSPDVAWALVLGGVCATPILKVLDQWREALCRRPAAKPATELVWHVGGSVIPLAVLVVSVTFLSAGTYNPFIYFRF